MRKKITMLLASLFVCMGAMKADVTDLPELTTSTGDIKWYTIKNTRSGKYAAFAGNTTQMTQDADISLASLFYFTAVDGEVAEGFTAVKIHTAATANLLSHYNSWATEGVTWYLHEDTQSKVDGVVTPAGLHITKAANLSGWNALNDANQTKITDYYSQDAGSVFVVEKFEGSISDLIEPYLSQIKNAAVTELESLGQLPAVYPGAAQTKTDVGSVNAAVTTVEDARTAYASIDENLLNVWKSIDGKSFKFMNCGTDSRGGRYLGYDNGNDRIAGILSNNDDAIWTIKYVGDNTFKLYNFVNNIWMGGPDYKWDESTTTNEGGETTTTKSNYRTPAIANEADAVVYKFNIKGENKVVLVTTTGKVAHESGNDNYRIMEYWNTDDAASQWAVTNAGEIQTTREEYTAFVEEKSTLLNSLTGYAKQLQNDYGFVKVADKIAVVVNHPSGSDSQPSSNLLDGNNGTFVHSSYDSETMNTVENHYIEVELSEATQNIFCYFSKRNNNNRPSVVKVLAGNSADALNEVATLNMAESWDNNVQSYFSEAIDLGAAYTHLRFVVTKTNTGTKYFTLSEFYVLSVNDVTKGIAELSGASIIDTDLEARLAAADNSLKTLQFPETLAEVKAVLDANSANHAVEPALGQYTTEAYNVLKSAYEACTSIEQLETVWEALDAFNKAKNVPVYFITSAWDEGYPAGKAILYNGSAWRFETADIYNKQMWMTIPSYAQANVPTVNAYDANGVHYEICDYLTGSVMRGKSMQIVAVDGWAGAYNLQYGIATNDAVQHAQSGGALVGWNPAAIKEDGTKDCGASAWNVEYIGSSYDLGKLSDEYFDAANQLAAVTVPSFNFAAGVNNYNPETKPALDAAVANRTAVLGKFSTAEEIADAKTQLETAIAGAQMNQPENGKFYRVRCAGSGMKYIQSTLDSSDASDIRLQMISGNDGKTVNATFCYIDGALLSYTTGQYINAYNYNEVGTKSTVTFSNASNGKVGAYNIMVGDRYIFGASDNNKIDSGKGTPDARDGYNWWLEEVTTLPVAVSAAGYATLYAPVALTIPTEGVTVYTATVEDGYLALNKVEGAIPANTGVVIEAAVGTYNFNVAAEAAAVESDLVGAYAKSEKKANAKVYTLQAPAEKEVGFYLFNGQDANSNKTYINGFRAWVEVEGAEAPAMFSLGRGEGTTAIDSVELTNGNVVIYDLAGRRVEKMEKGIYIVNGKKVIR